MQIQPLPPHPNAPGPAGLSPTRLWFLCLIAGFTRLQIAELTGISVEDVHGLQIEHDLFRADYESLVGRGVRNGIVRDVARKLGVLLPHGNGRRDVVPRLRRELRAAVIQGKVSWSEIDALTFVTPSQLYER